MIHPTRGRLATLEARKVTLEAYGVVQPRTQPMITSARTDSLWRCAKEALHLAPELATTSSSARSHDPDDGVREFRVRLTASAARWLLHVTYGLRRSLDV